MNFEVDPLMNCTFDGATNFWMTCVSALYSVRTFALTNHFLSCSNMLQGAIYIHVLTKYKFHHQNI